MANLIYQNDDTPITWLSSTGSKVLTLTSLAAGVARQGAINDFGADARSQRFAWRFFCQFATTPVLGETVEIYWKSAGAAAAHPDNDDGTGDADVSALDKLRNLLLLGVLQVDEAAADIEMVASGEIILPHQQGMPVISNATADALSATALEHGFTLTPIPLEVQ